jgi:hypothetical protein
VPSSASSASRRLARGVVQPPGDHCQPGIIMRSTRRVHQVVEPIAAGAQNPLAREPTGDRFLQCQRSRLSGQAVGQQPDAEGGFFLFAKLPHRQMGEHHATVPTPGAAGEVIACEDFGRNADLTGEVLDNGGCDIRLNLRKARVLSPEGELAHQAEFRLPPVVNRKPEVVGRERPAYGEFVRRPQPLISTPLT